MGSPPSSAHPCAVTKRSEDVWMHLRAWTTSQPPVYLSPCSRLSQMLSHIITFLVCGCVGRGRDWDPWSETFDSLNNDVVSNCDDCLYLKWTDGLRSRWVPAGTSYPESTKSCVLGIIQDILSLASPERCSSQQIIIFPFHKKTSNATDSSMPHLLTVARHLSPIWPQPERLFHKSLEDRQPWNSLSLYWTWQGKPGESFRCDQLLISHLTNRFLKNVLTVFLPVQRSHCKHAAGLQAMWLNSRGWRGW